MNKNPLRDFLNACECAESAWTVKQWLNDLTPAEKQGLAPCLRVTLTELTGKYPRN